jgi:Zn-dependent protease with chaperone function
MVATTGNPMSAPGRYFDGHTSARRDVTVTLGANTLRIAAVGGGQLAEWGYAQIEGLEAPADVLRLGRRHSAGLERLEIFDTAFAAELDARAEYVDRTGALHRHQRASVVLWTVAATVVLVLAATFGVPAVADRLAPLMPLPLERRIGDAVDVEVRSQLDSGHPGQPFECGRAPGERAGAVALAKIMQRLEANAALGFPLTATVVRRKETNAITLPGGRIYVFQGLIDKAESPDELAGVIGHEIGHAAHRDGTKALLQSGGLSLLFGMLLGDFVGGGAVVMSAKTVLKSTYSRRVEAAADAYGAELMNRSGGDARALASMLARIGGATEPGMTILLDHPETKARVEAVNRIAAPHDLSPFLDPREWNALKHICSG